MFLVPYNLYFNKYLYVDNTYVLVLHKSKISIFLFLFLIFVIISQYL